MADDIINQLALACVCGPLDADGACLLCCARTEIERGWAEASLKGYRLDDALDEIERLRTALALAVGEMSTSGEYSYLSPEVLLNKFLKEAERE